MQDGETLTGWPRDEAIGRGLATVFQNVDPDTCQRYDNSIAALTEMMPRRRTSSGLLEISCGRITMRER